MCYAQLLGNCVKVGGESCVLSRGELLIRDAPQRGHLKVAQPEAVRLVREWLSRPAFRAQRGSCG